MALRATINFLAQEKRSSPLLLGGCGIFSLKLVSGQGVAVLGDSSGVFSALRKGFVSCLL